MRAYSDRLRDPGTRLVTLVPVAGACALYFCRVRHGPDRSHVRGVQGRMGRRDSYEGILPIIENVTVNGLASLGYSRLKE
jgi:hypothetical protein